MLLSELLENKMESKANDSLPNLKDVQLKKIIIMNERVIDRHQAEIKRLKAEIMQIRSEVLSKKDEAYILKNELRGTEKQIHALQAERRKLLNELAAATKGKRLPNIDEQILFEMHLSSRKETLKLMQYDNALRDREISRLERKLEAVQKEMSSKVASPSQSKPDVHSQTSTILENSLTPKALVKLQRHATKYSNQEHQRKVRSNSAFRKDYGTSF